jgi:repressor LexA
MDRRLTERQQHVLAYIDDYLATHQVAPSLAEIGRAAGNISATAALAHVAALEKKGYVRRNPHQARSIEVVPRPTTSEGEQPPLLRLPIMGTIAAGQPIEALVDGSETMLVESSLARGPDNFILRIRGNSMIGDGICDGDMVIVAPQTTAQEGETVVALLTEDVVTLKRFYREHNRIRLQPANPLVEPMYVSDVTIQGRVVAVIRRYP